MAEQFAIYLRPGKDFDFPPPPVILTAVKALVGISEEVFHELASDLAAYPGFLSSKVLEKLVAKHVSDPTKAKGVAQALQIVGRYLANKEATDLIERIPKWQAEPGAEIADPLSPENLEKLRRVIPLITGFSLGLKLQVKAERLADAVGHRVEAIDLICDVRPVFDDSRRKIEGMIPLTTLRIVASRVDKFPITFEAVLSAKDVEALLKKTKDAVEKLNALGRLAEQNNLPVPAVDLTEPSE